MADENCTQPAPLTLPEIAFLDTNRPEKKVIIKKFNHTMTHVAFVSKLQMYNAATLVLHQGVDQ